MGRIGLNREIATLGHPMIDLNYFARGNFVPNSDEEWQFVEKYFASRTAKLPLISKLEWRFFGLMVSYVFYAYTLLH